MKKRFLLIALELLFIAFYTQAALVINEVCYDNSKVEDENGDDSSDWIEIYNNGTTDVNVNGYGVGDANPYEESKGVRLPDYTIPPGGFLLVYANNDLPETNNWVQAEDYEAVPENSSWKYWDEGSEPAGSWTESSYSDSSWSEGISPLGHNTTLDSMDCATVLGDPDVPSTLHQTIYFRKKFTVPKPSVVTGLVMRARFMDGVAVYLNGSVLHRRNLPFFTPTYSTLALDPVPSTTWTEELYGPENLVQGENTIAIEVHKASASGSTIIMDFSLTALVDEMIPLCAWSVRFEKRGRECASI